MIIQQWYPMYCVCAKGIKNPIPICLSLEKHGWLRSRKFDMTGVSKYQMFIFFLTRWINVQMYLHDEYIDWRIDVISIVIIIYYAKVGDKR